MCMFATGGENFFAITLGQSSWLLPGASSLDENKLACLPVDSRFRSGNKKRAVYFDNTRVRRGLSKLQGSQSSA